jgi:hypothetical protein
MQWMSQLLRKEHPEAAATLDNVSDPEQLVEVLSDGVILINLCNCILPNTIKKFNKSKSNQPMSKFKRLENIQKFTKACRNKLGLISEVIFASSDLEIGGFGGNGSSNVISTLKHLMDETSEDNNREARSSAPKKGLVEIEGYPEDEECFYMNDDGDVVSVILAELIELYETDDLDVRLMGSTQVSFGEDWKPLNKWLGERKNSEQVPLWKMKKGGVGSAVETRAPPPKPNRKSFDKVQEEVKENINTNESGEKWYFEDDDNFRPVAAGPFDLEQMQMWYEIGKLREDQLVWYEVNGEPQMVKTEASEVRVLKENRTSAPPPPNTKKSARPPPPKPRGSGPPSRPPSRPSSKPSSKPSLIASSSDSVIGTPKIEYRRGLLGKFARSRKRHSSGHEPIFRSKNWKKRFFVLTGDELEYYETRTKFIRRKPRSGGIKLNKDHFIPKYEGREVKRGRYMFELRRGGSGFCVLKMYADDETDRELWIKAIEECISNSVAYGSRESKE